MPKVIEWVNPGPEDIIWTYPDEEIEWGSQLIVHEYEVAVFYRDGKVYDVLRAGRHTLTTQTLPLLTRVLSRIAGFDRIPFRAKVIFVSLRQFRGLFGGRTQTTEIAPLMFRGSFYFRVADPVVFVNEVVGGRSLFTTEDVNEFLRGFVNELMIKHLAKFSIIDVFTNVDKVSTIVKLRLLDDFKRIGLELIDLKFEGIDTTDEWRRKIFWLRQTASPTTVLQMETLREVAKELGKSPGAAVGAGLAIVPPLVYPTGPGTPTQVQRVFHCPYCGSSVPIGAKFCPNCGKPLKICPQGHVVPPDAKFCPICGSKIE